MDNNYKKVKVLHVTSGISAEGIGTFVLNSFENIDKEKVEMSFALATDWQQHHEERVKKQGGKVYRTAEIGKGLSGIVSHFVNLIRILKTEGPFDVVHSHMDFFNGLNVFAAFIAGVPNRISHAHRAVGKEYISLPKKVYSLFMKMLINVFATNKLGCSVMANDYMNDFRWMKNKNSFVLFNGINLCEFTTTKHPGKKNNNINFFTIGRIDDPKNPFFIVKIIKELKSYRNNIHFYWIGTGSLEKEVKQFVKKYDLEDNITFLGIRDDIGELLTSMDFMLFPSKREGLPIVLLEAQASGIPCFISDTITQEVDLGLCTVLSLNEDEKMWASKINNYINTKSFNKTLNINRLKAFDIKNTVKELEAFYLQNINELKI
jgi:glycosyltransferase EpsF